MGAGLLQPTHVIFVIVIALLVFGPKRLPEMGRAIGQGIREFKGSIDGSEAPEPLDGTSSPSAAQTTARVSTIPPAEPLPATGRKPTNAPRSGSRLSR